MDGQTAKHRQVYEHLRQLIEQGGAAPGARLPTEQALGAQFGVSRPTVVRALYDLEREGWIRRRRGSGSYVAPRGQAGGVFGVIVSGIFAQPGLDSTIFARILDGMTRTGQQVGWTFLFAGPVAGRDPEELQRHLRRVARQHLEQRVAGVFFVPLMLPAAAMGVNLAVANEFRRAGVPVVLVDRDLVDYPRRSDFDLVGIDNREAGYLAARHLLERGCRRPHFVGSAWTAATVTARYAGYCDALAEAGLAVAPGWLHRPPEFDRAGAAALLRAGGADAYLCYNDEVAAFLLRELLAQGRAVPGDVRLAGFDDGDWSRHLPVPLTTVRQPAAWLGEAAIRLMQQRREEPDRPAQAVCLRPELVVRESSG